MIIYKFKIQYSTLNVCLHQRGLIYHGFTFAASSLDLNELPESSPSLSLLE